MTGLYNHPQVATQDYRDHTCILKTIFDIDAIFEEYNVTNSVSLANQNIDRDRQTIQQIIIAIIHVFPSNGFTL